MVKKALIVGHTGQDGFYLNEILIREGYTVCGISSQSIAISEEFNLDFGDLSDYNYCVELISKFKPDQLYYLAAKHQSSIETNQDDLNFYKDTLRINAENYLNLLNAIVSIGIDTHCFYASSSHVFAGIESVNQNELTPLKPISIYGVSKILGMHFSDLFIQKGLNCSVGILYNHESPRRSSKFVSKKIVEAAVAIKYGKQNELILGDLSATIDWGYAPDYMQAAFIINQSNSTGQYIISSGKLHTVKDFVESVFNLLELNWKDYVKVNSSIIQKKSTTILFGDNSKLYNDFGWSPSTNFNNMIQILVKDELNKYQ